MSAVASPALVVTAARERAYLALRHGLHPAGQPLSMEQLAAAHAGLHAARLPTPFVTLRTRLPGFTATDLRSALEPGGGLIKLRTCRRTLHIYRLDDAPAAHAATVRQRLGACAAATRRLGYDPTVPDPSRAAGAGVAVGWRVASSRTGTACAGGCVAGAGPT